MRNLRWSRSSRWAPHRGETVEIRLGGTGLKEVQRVLYSRGTILSESRPDGRIAFTVEGDTPHGEGDLWVVTPTGLSNPRRFAVNELPMVVEREKDKVTGSAPALKPPIIIAGTIDTPTDQDHYSVELERGQHVSMTFRSTSLEGSVLPALTVFAPDGQEWMHDRGGEAEPTLDLVAPASGLYRIRVQDRSYRRDSASTYQVVLQTAPRLVAAFPHVLTRGKSQRVQLFGYQIRGGEPAGAGFAEGLMRLPVDIDAPTSGEPDGAGLTLSHAVMLERFGYQHPGTSGSIKFELVDNEVTLERDTRHDTAGTAQEIALGASIAGKFLRPAEIDWYRFSAKKGQTLWLEAVGERTGLAMDLDMAIYDLQGKLLTAFADTPHPNGSPKSFPLETLDPMGAWKAPADGEYNLVIRDLYGPNASGPGEGLPTHHRTAARSGPCCGDPPERDGASRPFRRPGRPRPPPVDRDPPRWTSGTDHDPARDPDRGCDRETRHDPRKTTLRKPGDRSPAEAGHRSRRTGSNWWRKPRVEGAESILPCAGGDAFPRRQNTGRATHRRQRARGSHWSSDSEVLGGFSPNLTHACQDESDRKE